MNRTQVIEPDTDVRKSKLGVMLSTKYLVPFTYPKQGLMFLKSMAINTFFSYIS